MLFHHVTQRHESSERDGWWCTIRILIAVALVLALKVGFVVADASAGDDPHYTATQHRMEQALADVTVLPGANRHDDSPDSVLDHQVGAVPTNGSHGLRRTAWWTAAAPLDAAARYYRSHVPAGFIDSGTGELPGVRTIDYRGPADNATNGLDVYVTVVAHGSDVAVRVDVYAVWLPSRSKDSIITDPRGVAVVVVRSGAPTVHRTLGAADARALARKVNELSTPATGWRSCGERTLGYDELRFATRDRTVVVHVRIGGCGETMLTDGHVSPVTLQSRGLDDAVRTAVGLPPG